MNVRKFVLIAATITALSSGPIQGTAVAHEPAATADQSATSETAGRVSVFGTLQPAAVTSSSDVRSSQKSVAELRQARGLYRANHRMARLEYNLWMGREPLRPQFNSIPMMSSRYTHRRVFVPVYVNVR